MTSLRLGTRGSKLALAQSNQVAQAITKATGVSVELVVISTRGDRIQNKPLAEIGGKGLFTMELEAALRDGSIDFAVHSLKDLPTDDPKGLCLPVTPKRADPRDVWVGAKDAKRVGTGSLRRGCQIEGRNPDVEILGIRGNVDTRINKIKENNLDGIILAAAGVKSLRLDEKIGFIFESDSILPAVGQGIIAVQCRKEDKIKHLIKNINDVKTSLCAIAERKMLQTIGGDCDTAIGGLAEIKNNNLKLRAQLFSDCGKESFEHELTGREADASFIGKSVAEKLLNMAGEKFKKK